MLTLLAIASLHLSEIASAHAWLASLLVLAYGAWLVDREWHRESRELHFAPDGRVFVDGIRVEGMCVQWRGPLAFMVWRDASGRLQRLAWWLDTLPGPRRRELRLAVSRTGAARSAGSVAP